MIRAAIICASLLLCADSGNAFMTAPSVRLVGGKPHVSMLRAVSRGRVQTCALKMTSTAPPPAVGSSGNDIPFTQEMRQRAMSLHTFSQAPKEGKVKDNTSNTQVQEWQTTKEDFLQFLVDSRVVYEAFEKAVKKPGLEKFQNTGLERVEGLNKDIAFIESEYGIRAQPPTAASLSYASFLLGLSPQVFITHFYNYYFAHTAGGRMIGKAVMDSEFGGHLFNFYKWDSDVKELLNVVKGNIDLVAAGWSREEKEASLDATPDTFVKAGALLRVLVGKAKDRPARVTNKVTVRAGKIVAVNPTPYSTRRQPWDV